jgi:hypothetical protein
MQKQEPDKFNIVFQAGQHIDIGNGFAISKAANTVGK